MLWLKKTNLLKKIIQLTIEKLNKNVKKNLTHNDINFYLYILTLRWSDQVLRVQESEFKKSTL